MYNETELRNKASKANLNLILIFCIIYTLHIIAGLLLYQMNDTFILHGTILLCVYTFLAFASIFLYKTHREKTFYLNSLFVLFYISTIINTYIRIRYHNASFEFVFSGIIILLILTSKLYIKNSISIPLYLIITANGLLITFSSDNHELYFIVLLFIALISTVTTHFRYQGLIKEVTNEATLKELKEMLDHLSNKDLLTNLYNNHFIHEKLNDEIERIKRYPSPLTIIMIDIDGFSKVNEKHGQVFGDEVLSTIGNILYKSCRTTDIIGRYSGEEFIIILPNTNLDESIIIAERIKVIINNNDFGYDEKITVSIGIKALEDENTKKLLKTCEQYIASAKAQGVNNLFYQ